MSGGSASSSSQIRISRSRRGCLACKRRHVKCDEQRPSCSHCIRRQERCEYHATVLPPFPGQQSQDERLVRPKPPSPVVLVQTLPQDADHAGVEAFQYFCTIVPGRTLWKTISIALKDSLMSAPKIAQWKEYLPVRAFMKALALAHRAVWDAEAGNNAPLYFSLVVQGLDALQSDKAEYPDEVVMAAHNVFNAAEAVRTADADRILYQEEVAWDALRNLESESPGYSPGHHSYKLAKKLRPYLIHLGTGFRTLLVDLNRNSRADTSLAQYLVHRTHLEVDAFTSFRHADAVLTNVTRRLFILFFDEYNYNHDVFFNERNTMRTVLADWERKFEELISRQRMPTPEEWTVAVSLRLRLQSSFICCRPPVYPLQQTEADMWKLREDNIEWLLRRAINPDSTKTGRRLSVVTLTGIFSQACACRYGPARRSSFRMLKQIKEIENADTSRVAFLIAKAADTLWTSEQERRRQSSGEFAGINFFTRTISADITQSRVWEPLRLDVNFLVLDEHGSQPRTVSLEVYDSDEINACRSLKWPVKCLGELFGYSKVFMIDAMHNWYVDGEFSPSVQERPL